MIQEDSQLADMFINYESDLYYINDTLIKQVEVLLQLFYAYSRSETKIDEKEIEFKH